MERDHLFRILTEMVEHPERVSANQMRRLARFFITNWHRINWG